MALILSQLSKANAQQLATAVHVVLTARVFAFLVLIIVLS